MADRRCFTLTEKASVNRQQLSRQAEQRPAHRSPPPSAPSARPREAERQRECSRSTALPRGANTPQKTSGMHTAVTRDV